MNQYAPKAEIWLGEGGGSGCGEGDATHQQLSNTATDMYWWLDALGNTAVHGHQRFLRETLAGGWYGMMNLTSMEVYPDYYAALLFTRLMGPTVLGVSVAQQPAPSASSPVRAYSHCNRAKGKLTVMLLNLGGQVSVKLLDSSSSSGGGGKATSKSKSKSKSKESPEDLLAGAGAAAAGYDIYRLQPGPEGAKSHSVKLNGAVLKLGPEGELPPMPGARSTARAIDMAPLDIVFCVLDAPATASRCGS